MLDKTTGTVFVREMPGSQMAGSGRRLLMVVGVIAVAEDSPLQGEHQYVVLGPGDGLVLNVMKDYAVNRTQEARGMTPDCLLCEPMWRT